MSNRPEVNTLSVLKKFSYAIRFLDEALQLVKTEKISEFSLCDEIRTKINNAQYFEPFEFLFNFRLVRERDLFVYFEKLWIEFTSMYAPMNSVIRNLKASVELRDRILYPGDYELKFHGNLSG